MSSSHRDTRELLADYAARRLGARHRQIVEGHLGECPDCQEWLETYRLLASGLAAEQATDHLRSADLATWAVLDDPLPSEAVAHVAACATCRSELERVTASIQAARLARDEKQQAPWWRPGEHRDRAVWYAAASLVLVVAAGSFLFSLRGATTRAYEISGVALAGEQTIAARTIHASDVEIQPASEIIFHAQEVVVLGDNFVVDSQATFEATITPPLYPDAAGREQQTQPANPDPI